MKKINLGFAIFLILAMLVVPIFTFVSCDNGTFSLDGLTGTYENYIADDSSRCSRVSFNEGTYILTMIEDDVFEIALPNDMGGTCVFVKKRTENIDVKGRWESELLPFPIEFTENAYTIYKSNGETVENGSGSYTMDGNSFSADGIYGFTGLLAQSGNSYVYARGKNAIYTKVIE